MCHCTYTSLFASLYNDYISYCGDLFIRNGHHRHYKLCNYLYSQLTVLVYTYIYWLLWIHQFINRANICSHQKHFFRCDYSLFWRNDQNLDTYGDSPMPAVRNHACRHSDTMRVRGICELHFSTRKYWACSVSLICMPAHQSTLTTALTKTGISRQESFFFTFTWLKSTRLLKQKQRTPTGILAEEVRRRTWTLDHRDVLQLCI